MSRLVMVSDHVALPRDAKSGLLASALRHAMRGTDGLWFGWSGRIGEADALPHTEIDQGIRYVALDSTQQEHDEYVGGFAARTLWPLLHLRPPSIDFQREDWRSYVEVNARFADRLAQLLQPDDLVWIHDYHLIPLARLLRERGVTARLGFFLHTPFPPWELLRALPVHRELFEALAAYDLLGFHTDDYLRAFRDYLTHEIGGDWSEDGSHSMQGGNQMLRAAVFPLGIDADLVQRQALRAQRQEPCRQLAESLRGRSLLVGADRLDESAGLAQRMRAYGRFLDAAPAPRGALSVLQIVLPSRTDTRETRPLRRDVDALAGELNARYAQPDWTPLRLLNRPFPPGTLAGVFRLARVGVVTPLREGMNLVAKEFVAAQDADDPGVLVLSRFAGAAAELDAAVLVNPYDIDGVAKALGDALAMPLDERSARWQAMMRVLRRNSIESWRRQFLAALEH